RLGRVQVLRLASVEYAATEADDLAARRVADREHDAVAEAVVAAPVLIRDDEAGLQQLLDPRLGRAERLHDRVPGVGRVADAEVARGRAVDAALLEVGDRAVARTQRRAVDLIGFAQQRVEIFVIVLALGRGRLLARYLEAQHLG